MLMMVSMAFMAVAVTALQPPAAAAVPPADSPPLVRFVEIAFPAQGNASLIDGQTYLYYIQTRPSRPSENQWIPYDPSLPLEDFRRLWATGFLDDLWIEVKDVPYDNGVVGKHIIFNMEERQRVKIVDYAGSNAIESAKIDERLKDAGAQIRLDTFIDAGLVRKAEGIVRTMLQEKGFQLATVTHTIAEISGGPRLVHLTFHLEEGPKVKIRRVVFRGNQAIGASALKKQLKENKERAWWIPSFLGGGTTYQEAKFDEDADRVLQYYRDRGYVNASVGAPEIKTLSDAHDPDSQRLRPERGAGGKPGEAGPPSESERGWIPREQKEIFVELRIPVTEGERYRVGRFEFDGNTVVKDEALRPFFRLPPNGYYSEKIVRKGLEKAREVYGSGGYFEFTGYPDLKPRDAAGGLAADPPATLKADADRQAGSVVDVTLRIQEGQRYFVNRLSFVGNTITRDKVVRREVTLVEGSVFNTEALKYSVRRLNQLGYFKPIEDQKNVTVEKTAGTNDKVDVTLKLEEQNRNQLQFGAGLSEYEGIFGNLSYTTANFLGRGETLTLSVQKGSRANVYQIALTEPYLFDRAISASIDVYSRKYDYYTSGTTVGYSEVREGSTVSVGRPFRRFTRGYLNYTYEVIDVSIADSLLTSTTATAAGTPLFNPFQDSGRHIDSRVMPTLVYNTVDNPLTAHSGMRLTGSVQFAGEMLRGSYNYLKPELEAIVYMPTSRRTGFGFRGQGGLLRAYGTTTTLPYYLRYFLGGEYQIRGVNIRTVGPLDSSNRALGGNKFILFNAEYYFDIAGPVRLLAFHDAGQAFDETHPFNIRELRTSSGGELRVFVPVVNVPFRLIYYWNIYRDAFQPVRGFKFAVGTTF